MIIGTAEDRVEMITTGAALKSILLVVEVASKAAGRGRRWIIKCEPDLIGLGARQVGEMSILAGSSRSKSHSSR